MSQYRTSAGSTQGVMTTDCPVTRCAALARRKLHACSCTQLCIIHTSRETKNTTLDLPGLLHFGGGGATAPRRVALNESFHCPFRARLRTAGPLVAADEVCGFFRDDASLEGVCGGGGSTSISSPVGDGVCC